MWFEQLAPPDVAANLRVQRSGAQRVLTWWQGPVTAAAFGLGEGVIADSLYRTIRTVHAGNGYTMDLHEFDAHAASATALFTVYSPILVHLPGTPAGTLSPLLDAIVQEVDVRHRARDLGVARLRPHPARRLATRRPPTAPPTTPSTSTRSRPWPTGHVLVSARDTSAIYDIDRATGAHRVDARRQGEQLPARAAARTSTSSTTRRCCPERRVSLFDDEAGPPQKAPSSRGLILKLDLRRRTATVACASIIAPADTSAQSEGSVQTLPRRQRVRRLRLDAVLLGVRADGRLLFDARCRRTTAATAPTASRGTARPATPPVVAVAPQRPHGRVAVYASWNGASDVARWQVSRPAGATSLAPIPAARTDFETRIDVTSVGHDVRRCARSTPTGRRARHSAR